MAASLMTGCGGGGNSGDDVPKIDGLKYESTMELKYATQFQVYNYEGGYSYIRIIDGEDVLIVAYPPLSTSNIPSALLHDANANILVASADRGWKTIDKQLCEQLTQQLSKTDVPFRICLTNANRDAVEDFTGQLPPHTLLRRIGYRLSQ